MAPPVASELQWDFFEPSSASSTVSSPPYDGGSRQPLAQRHCASREKRRSRAGGGGKRTNPSSGIDPQRRWKKEWETKKLTRRLRLSLLGMPPGAMCYSSYRFSFSSGAPSRSRKGTYFCVVVSITAKRRWQGEDYGCPRFELWPPYKNEKQQSSASRLGLRSAQNTFSGSPTFFEASTTKHRTR